MPANYLPQLRTVAIANRQYCEMLSVEEEQNSTFYLKKKLGFFSLQALMFSEIRMLEVLRGVWQTQEDLLWEFAPFNQWLQAKKP